MSADWYKEQPTNRNFLNPIGFLLKLEKFDGVDFFCHTIQFLIYTPLQAYLFCVSDREA